MDEPTRAAVTFGVLPCPTGVGGPASFRRRFVSHLGQNGYRVVDNPHNPRCTAILLIGGSARLIPEIWRARRRGVRIVQRLNGMNWMHRQGQGSLRYYLRAEFNNWVLRVTRKRLADRIIYQSRFARGWWDRSAGVVQKPSRVIYNAVDLKRYYPEGEHRRPTDHYRLLVVEGHIGGGYEHGLAHAVALAQRLNRQLVQPVELMVVGEVSKSLRSYWKENSDVWITWRGVVEAELIPEINRSAHLLFSADLNAACPNSVIEALSCGLPVTGFATGALPELVGDHAGQLVAYGGDPWTLEQPNIDGLAGAARTLLAEQSHYRLSARRRAEALFDLNFMVEEYLKMLL
ncbi:MAG: glycosyltransferase family 4 protein [Anaerolineaceae bacterium]|nr:glycosyltransferase family 4 protein [Anaerolineaceae bacterium]